MPRFTVSAIILVAIMIVIGGCASTPVYWKKETWAKQTPEDARAYCNKQARVDTEIDSVTANQADPQWSDYMKECMASHGYTLVRGHEPAPENKGDKARGTASVL